MLSELEACHSRPVSPTRRVALGKRHLPQGYGPLLLSCIAGWYSLDQDEDFYSDAATLLRHIKHKSPIAQPHLRHRFQVDLVGLSRSTHGLRRSKAKNRTSSSGLEFVSEVKTSSAVPHVLCAMYATGSLSGAMHQESCRLIEEALRWAKKRSLSEVDASAMSRKKLVERDELLFYLMLGLPLENGTLAGERHASWDWAMDVLEFTESDEANLTLQQIENRYRQLLKVAHPDRGGNAKSAPSRIANLAKARKILSR